jgi:hypothetical protein
MDTAGVGLWWRLSRHPHLPCVGRLAAASYRQLGHWAASVLAPHQVWAASDDFVFVADYGNHRVQVLTPRLDFHGFVGVVERSAILLACAPMMPSSWCQSRLPTASARSSAATALSFVASGVMAVAKVS